MHSEIFWLFCSFIALFTLTFKKIKKFLVHHLETKISNTENQITEILNAKIESLELLKDLNEKYNQATIESKDIIKQSEDDAYMLFEETQYKIQQITKLSERNILNHTKNSEYKINQTLKQQCIQFALKEIKEKLTNKSITIENLKILDNNKNLFHKLKN